MALSNVKLRIMGYAILGNTNLWLKLRPNDGITSPDFAGIVKLSRERQ